LVDVLQGVKAPPFTFLLGERGGGMGHGAWKGLQAHAPDVEVFFEAIELEQVGELEGTDIAAAFADFALQISDHPAQVLWREACPQPLIPLPFPVKAQAQALTGQLAVKLMGGGNLLGADAWRHTFS